MPLILFEDDGPEAGPIVEEPLPDRSFLAAYDEIAGAYTDSFVAEIDGDVSLADFISAFMTTPLFRLERLALRLLGGHRPSDSDVRALADGRRDRLALWRVEERGQTQLLLEVMGKPLRSWFMVAPGEAGRTRRWFGSALLPVTGRAGGEKRLPLLSNSLIGPHRLYARLLLGAAARRLGGAKAGRSAAITVVK